MQKSPEVTSEEMREAIEALREETILAAKERLKQMQNGEWEGSVTLRHSSDLPSRKYFRDGLSLEGMLHEWGAMHGVDGDLALFICASVTAHVAGPKLRFRGGELLGGSPPPTLIAAAEALGAQQATAAAMEGLRSLQQAMTLKARGLSRKALDLVMDFRDSVERNHTSEIDFKSDHVFSGTAPMELDLQILPRQARYETLVRPQFMIDGTLPKKPADALSCFHLGTALASGEVECLPKSKRAREARIDVISAAITGVRVKSNTPRAASSEGTGSIRGILRFMRTDLEWLINHRPDFMLKTVPIQSLIGHSLTSVESEQDDARVFEFLRWESLGITLDARRKYANCSCGLSDKDADNLFLQLRKTYREETTAMKYPVMATAALPDLLVWYLLNLQETFEIRFSTDTMLSVAFKAARNLRHRVVAFYEQREKTLQARERLELAAKMIERMRHLGGPCKRRELVRGLNSQRLEVVAPVIDSLVGIGFFTQTDNLFELTPEANVRTLCEADFMEFRNAGNSSPEDQTQTPEPFGAKTA